MPAIPSTTSGRLAMAALVGMAIAYLVTNIAVEGKIAPFSIVFVLILLGLAALTALGRWWAYAVAALVAGLMFFLTFTGSFERLTNPTDPAFFGVVLFLAFGGIAVVAGVWAALQTRRSP